MPGSSNGHVAARPVCGPGLSLVDAAWQADQFGGRTAARPVAAALEVREVPGAWNAWTTPVNS
ncbi:hypothetical protein [Mesorhizobium sp. CO1-1-4]|uniref:hypothetical protein n=1 Tax=Mesorhizobium sp. CO1-1-4 TaxID=2876633 RepID=UPI001CC9A0D3|nr:hypothetical protein [Mesorhizobium sp. CO1-1-4]MBZ9740668.1 hypothetical protein [Mesorhizobium sp. CO1-1-4]